MNKAKGSVFGWILPTLAVLLGLLAVVSMSARWLISDIEQYRETIVSQFSKTLELDASIAELEGRVDFINPVIYAERIELSNPETSNQPLLVNQMEIVIDLLGSVLHAAPRLKSIRMSGIELAIATDLENRLLHLPQIDRQLNIPARQFNLSQLLGKAVAMDYFDLVFDDVLIHWHDKNAGSMQDPQTFRVAHFGLNPQFHQTRLNLVAELPQTLGRALTLITTIEHDISNPGGDFYINAEDLRLANVYEIIGERPTHQGYLHAELWGRASYRQGLEDLTGTLSLKDYLNPALNLDDAISHLKTALNWQAQPHSRELGLANLSLQSGWATVENADVALVQIQRQDDYFGNLRFYADYISPSIYNRLLSYMQTDFGIEQSRAETAPRKQAIDLILQTRHTADWFVSPHDWPPIQALQSISSADLPQPLNGRLELMLDDVRLSRGEWTAPQNLERIELKGTYKGNAEHSAWHLEHLYIKGSDSDLSGNIAYRITDNEDKRLQSSLRLHNLAATEIVQWLAPQMLQPKLENWLRNAFGSGTVRHAELSIDGNPAFPFAKDAGLWRLHAQAEDLSLRYRNKDPELKELNLDLLLENQSLKIQSDHLRTMDFYAKDTTVLLEDIAEPYVKISSRGRGPLADILSYATTTGLVDPTSVLVSNIEADGDVDINLKVHTRLSPAVERETYVGGYIDLDGAALKLKTPDLELKQLEGRLNFDRLGGRSDDIKALLNGAYPLTATAEADEGSTMLKMETRIPFPADYLQTLSLPTNTFNTAADTWRAELRIPPLRATPQEALQLKLNSKLEALAVNMPAPLYKRAGEITDSALIVKITKLGADYQVDYGDRLRLTLNIPSTGTTTGLLRFSPHIAYPYPTNDDSRFTVRGVIPHISINEWQTWLANYQKTETQQPAQYAQDLDVLIEKLVWNTSTANQVHTVVKRQQDKTSATFDSAEIKGSVSIPADQDERVYIDLEHLILSDDSVSSDSHKPDPTALPPMAVKIHRFKRGHFDIADVRMTLFPDTDGVKITKISFNKKDDDKILMQAQLEGEWTRVAGQDRSRFKFLFSSEDYGRLLRDWNFYSGLKAGRGQIRGQLNWQDTPLAFELDRLRGPINLQVKEGVIETIEPGVGRLFGLLNINALARRLTLDFKDVFDKGFEFDDMQGTLEFEEANLITRDLDINGPALDMTIKGRTGIARRDYDQKIVVTPHVGTNVALATAFLGGPLTAATVFLLSQVTRLDNWVDKIITLEYTLKGSWDEPEVEFISAPVAEKLDPMKPLKAPTKHIKSLLDKIFPSKTE